MASRYPPYTGTSLSSHLSSSSLERVTDENRESGTNRQEIQILDVRFKGSYQKAYQIWTFDFVETLCGLDDCYRYLQRKE